MSQELFETIDGIPVPTRWWHLKLAFGNFILAFLPKSKRVRLIYAAWLISLSNEAIKNKVKGES